MSIYITQSTLSSWRNHLIVGTIEVLEILSSILPLVELSAAKTSIEVSQITCSSAAVLISELNKTLEVCAVTVKSLLVVASHEEFLTLSDSCASLNFLWTADVSLIQNYTSNDYYESYYSSNNSLLVLKEEGLTLIQALLHSLSGLLLICCICHYNIYI